MLLIQIRYVIRAGIHIFPDKDRIYQDDTLSISGVGEEHFSVSLHGSNIFAWFI